MLATDAYFFACLWCSLPVNRDGERNDRDLVEVSGHPGLGDSSRSRITRAGLIWTSVNSLPSIHLCMISICLAVTGPPIPAGGILRRLIL